MDVFISALVGGTHLASCSYISGWHLIETLLNDSQTLSHFRHPLQISVIAISIGSHRNIKVNQVIGIIGSSFSNVIFDSCASEHDSTASPVDGIFRGDDANIDGSLSPQSVVSHNILHFIESLTELGDKLIDIVQKTDGNILMSLSPSSVRDSMK